MERELIILQQVCGGNGSLFVRLAKSRLFYPSVALLTAQKRKRTLRKSMCSYVEGFL
jgi:hypothetical protein